MIEVSDDQFQELIDQALAQIPVHHQAGLKNVAILYESVPNQEQRLKLQLRHNQTLFGLYEGVPLAERQGQTAFLPDRITIFKDPLCAVSGNTAELKENIRHTLWHEIAHYYGLNHDQIRQLDN